jgi:hypothetical protein
MFIIKHNYLFLKNSKNDLILLDLGINVRNKQEIKTLDRVVSPDSSKEEFYVTRDETKVCLSSQTISLDFIPNYPKYNQKTCVIENNEKEFVFILKFTFFIRTLFCTKPLPNKKKDSISIYRCENRHDRFIYENVLYKVNRFEEASFGHVRESSVKLTSFYNPRKDNSITLEIPTVCYDVETCVFQNKQHQAYLLCYKYSSGRLYVQDYDTDVLISHYDLTTKSSIGHQFCMSIISLCSINELTKLIIFGYNNNNFDDHFILEAFCNNGFTLEKHERNAKVSNTILTKGELTIEIKDLIKWLPDVSLSEACINFNTKELKGECKIVPYNKMCEKEKRIIMFCSPEEFWPIAGSPNTIQQRKLKQTKYFSEGKFNVLAYVEDYCRDDVKATYGLYLCLNRSFLILSEYFKDKFNIELRKKSILHYLSPAFVSSLIYKQAFDQQGLRKIFFNDFKMLADIKEAYFGGLVAHSYVGLYESKNLKTYDVTAQYPSVMTGNYPAIRKRKDFVLGLDIDIDKCQSIIDGITKAREIALKNERLFVFNYFKPFDTFKGIFYCNINAPIDENNNICQAPMPQRQYGSERLLYNHESKRDQFICTSDMKSLILAGFTITLKEHASNLLFNKFEPLFKSVLLLLNDYKVAAKDNDDEAIKKLIKLLMNSISGKLGQHIEHTITDFFESDNSHKYLKTKQSNNKSSLHYLACFITAEARHVIYSKIYQLHESCIYKREPMSMRTGRFLYCDTDSITLDIELSDPINFIIGNELGYWDEDNCCFVMNWKEKVYPNQTGLFILGRKSYAACNVEKKVLICKTLKGIKSELLEYVTFDSMKEICDNIPQTLKRSGLKKELFKNEYNNINYAKALMEVQFTMKLKISNHNKYIECTHPKIVETNKHNLLTTIYKDTVKHFLKFCVSQ